MPAQGLDPRVAEAWCRGPPAVVGDAGLCDPLKGWARKDGALADPFSIQQPLVDRACADLNLVEVTE